MRRSIMLAVLLLALLLAACNNATAGTEPVDVRERFVLVGLSGQKAPNDPTRVYAWQPGLAIGGDKVIFSHTARGEQPEEILVAWPGGEVTPAELEQVHPDYNLVYLRAPGGRQYPRIEQPATPLAPGEAVTVVGHAEPFYLLGKGVTEEPQPPADLPGLVEMEGTVLSPGMRFHPMMAAQARVSEEAAYLVVDAQNPDQADAFRSAVVRDGQLYGLTMHGIIVTSSSGPAKNAELWVIPTSVLLGGEAALGEEVPSAGGRIMPGGPRP